MPDAQSCAEFVKAAGARLAHVTAASNLPGIRKDGLLPAAELARRAGMTAQDLHLRKERLRVGEALLNHQRPILHGLRAANAILEGHTPESWSAILDKRVFLWPEKRGAAFQASIARDVPICVLWLDTARLWAAMQRAIDLSPINSGNFTQGGARAKRGDWLFVPLTSGLEQFRINRQKRNLVKGLDSVVEISLRAPIPPDNLSDIWLETKAPSP